MRSDGKSTTLTADGDVFAGPARIASIYYVASATAGSVVIKDGGASGTTVVDLATPASATATQFIDFSGNPIRCSESAYCDLTDVTSVTVVYV
jgi:hypothetical protein